MRLRAVVGPCCKAPGTADERMRCLSRCRAWPAHLSTRLAVAADAIDGAASEFRVCRVPANEPPPTDATPLAPAGATEALAYATWRVLCLRVLCAAAVVSLSPQLPLPCETQRCLLCGASGGSRGGGACPGQLRRLQLLVRRLANHTVLWRCYCGRLGCLCACARARACACVRECVVVVVVGCGVRVHTRMCMP